MLRYDVAIVGGGPVGLACAAELALHGLRCAVIEPQVSIHRIPKGQNLMQRSVEHFARWGCASELRARRIMPPGYPIGGVVAYRDFTSEHWHAPPGRERLARFFAEANERLPQYYTEAVLREHIAALPTIDTLYGSRAVEVSQDSVEAHVSFVGTGEGDNRSGELHADFVIGCDGAGSLVRKQADIPFVQFGSTRTMVLAVFRSTELHEQLERFPQRTTYRAMHPDLNGYWRMFGRIDVGEGFFFHGPVPDDAGLDPELDGPRILSEAAGFPFACEVDYLARWEARTAIAERYRNGRVFIAGDACHVHPPYGGFGLNSGLEDAVNLTWKLAAAIEGWGGDALLDSYDAERRPVFTETADQVINAWIAHDRDFLAKHTPEDDPEAFEAAWGSEMAMSDTGPTWFEPHYEGSPVVDGPRGARCGVFGEYSVRARPGHTFASSTLSDGRRAFDVLGPGFTLFGFDGEEDLSAEWQEAAATMGIPLAVTCDSWEGERREYGSRLVLVRPDRFVAWVGHDTRADPLAVLEQVVGRTRVASTLAAGDKGPYEAAGTER